MRSELQLSGNVMLKRFRTTTPIFADLVVEVNGEQARFDVEQKGYLEQVNALMPLASRVGLALRGRDAAVWVQVNGKVPHYYSQVVGEIGDGGHRQVRIACLDCGDYKAWLHKDGTVEVGQTPMVRW